MTRILGVLVGLFVFLAASASQAGGPFDGHYTGSSTACAGASFDAELSVADNRVAGAISKVNKIEGEIDAGGTFQGGLTVGTSTYPILGGFKDDRFTGTYGNILGPGNCARFMILKRVGP